MYYHFLQRALLYQWLEDSLRLGEKVSEDLYNIKVDREGDNIPDKSLVPKEANKNTTSDEEPSYSKKIRSSPEDSKNINAESKEDAKSSALYDAPSTPGRKLFTQYSKPSEYQSTDPRSF